MCCLRNIAMHDYQESVTTRQTHGQIDRRKDRQMLDKVIPMCRYAKQATQKTMITLCRINVGSLTRKNSHLGKHKLINMDQICRGNFFWEYISVRLKAAT